MVTRSPKRFLVALALYVFVGPVFFSTGTSAEKELVLRYSTMIDKLILKQNEFCAQIQYGLESEIKKLYLDRFYAVPQSYVLPVGIIGAEPPASSLDDQRYQVVSEATLACKTMKFYQDLLDEYENTFYPLRRISAD